MGKVRASQVEKNLSMEPTWYSLLWLVAWLMAFYGTVESRTPLYGLLLGWNTVGLLAWLYRAVRE